MRLLVLLFCFLGLVGCQRPTPTPVPSTDPVVVVDQPKMEDHIDFEEFTGRTEAVESVELRSRVTGYLKEVHFKDGEIVEAGKLLFSIDDRLIRAELERAKANVILEETRLARISKEFERLKKLRSSGAISEDEFERIEGDNLTAQAALSVAKAQEKSASENLTYTKILAPISGRMSRRFTDPGNLVRMDDTALSLLIRTDPLYVYFDVDDRTLLALRRAISEKKLKFDTEGQTTVEIGLPDEERYSITGKLNFIDNRVDAGTGTLRLRATIDNSKGILAPGLFVRVKLPISDSQSLLTVPEVALGTNQGLKYVYALNDKDEVVERRVRKLGKQFGPGRVLLESEVLLTDRIIISGGQRVRPGVKTNPKPSAATKPASTPPSQSASKSGS
ncbi:MAG: efflux RND transporter periplasmic adaptor subunit [Fimbriiglobus sp.]